MVIALIVACALFMENLDGTVITTALPAMSVSLGTTPVRLSLGITSYMLSLAIFIPVSGWVADRYGARTVFRAAIGVFTLGSILCGLCGNLAELTGARVLQGIGGAMMVPVGRLVLIRSVEKSELVRAMAYLTVPALIGPLLGPPVGGFITTYVSWRWIFFLNVPIGILGMVLATLMIENYCEEERPPLDWGGFALTGVSLTCLMYAFDLAGHPAADGQIILALLGAGVIVGVIAIRHARGQVHPIVDLSLLRVPSFAATISGGSLFRVCSGTLPFLLPLLFQIGFGMSAFASGLLTFAGALGSFTMKMSAQLFLRRFGFRTVLVSNTIISALSIIVCASFTAATPAIVIFVLLLAGGFFRSLQYTSLNTLAFADIVPRKMSAATSFSSMMQQLSNGMGVALGAALLNGLVVWRNGAGQGLSVGDLQLALATAGILSVAALPFFLRLPPDAGTDVSGHCARGREALPSRRVAAGGD
jgi:EmrB/QacA subfamily drug resistance transporter